MVHAGAHRDPAAAILNSNSIASPASRSFAPPARPSGMRRALSAATGKGLPAEGPILCLERAIGERSGADAALWATGAFDAQVYPDLPFASSWPELVQKVMDAVTSSGGAPAPPPPPSTGPGLKVRTVGAQCASRGDLQAKIQAASLPGPDGGGADALLFVSGSHPARAVPFAESLLQSSFSMLRDAAAMRAAGDLPPNLGLWAVENPTNPPERLLRKVDAGAEAVLTQPPFVRASAEVWFREAVASGAAAQAPIMAGVPMATSPGNLSFWLGLCGVAGTPQAEAVARGFPSPGAYGSKQEYDAAVRAWNEEFVRWVSEKKKERPRRCRPTLTCPPSAPADAGPPRRVGSARDAADQAGQGADGGVSEGGHHPLETRYTIDVKIDR